VARELGEPPTAFVHRETAPRRIPEPQQIGLFRDLRSRYTRFENIIIRETASCSMTTRSPERSRTMLAVTPGMNCGICS
jgi:hypothetical protein